MPSIASHRYLVVMVKEDAFGHGVSDVTEGIQDPMANIGVCCLQESLPDDEISLPIVLIECFFF